MSADRAIRFGAIVVAVLLGIYLNTPADAPKQGSKKRSTPIESGVDYFNTRPIFWSKLYPNGGETLYCGRSFSSNRGRSINIEHIFPMSWAMNKFDCRDRDHCRNSSREFNRIEADMHNLYPARQDINSARSSYAFGMIKGEKRYYGKCDFEVNKYKRRAEPRPKVRGNIARAMFYMQQKYGLTIFKKQGELLKQWHRQDPPDAEERRRNDVIEKIQGNRNQFIDQPGLVYKIQL